MREDLVCILKGRIVDPATKQPSKGYVEFLPEFLLFTADGIQYPPLGARKTLDENGEFTVTLTRFDLNARVRYIVNGVAGRHLITLKGPGPHNFKQALENGMRLKPDRRDA